MKDKPEFANSYTFVFENILKHTFTVA